MVDGSSTNAHQDTSGGIGGPVVRTLAEVAEVSRPKFHALVDGLGHALHVHLAAGNVNDVSQAQQLIALAEGRNFIEDIGCDANHVPDAVARKGMTAVLPSLSLRKTKRVIDGHAYQERHLVENFLCKFKRSRRVVTRHEKTALKYLGFVLF
ncbi:MAG: hypothetical protein RL199_899 [Pseudomonadota bacterium]